jgi:pimeloyl-ACP methyl ester carboxylesterase
MEAALRQSGLTTLNVDYASRKKPIEALAADIHRPIAEFALATDGPIHIVAHSMAGLLARAYIARHRPVRLGRVVMLGTPNGGSEVADFLKRFALYRAFYGPAGQQLTTARDPTLRSLPPLDYAVGIIAGIRTLDPFASCFILPRPNDGQVSLQSCKLQGMADHIAIEASHTGLVRDPAAIAQTIAFLDSGRFKSSCMGGQSCR